MAGRVDHPQDHLAEHDLLAVFERIVLVLRLSGGMDRDRDPVLEREPTVAGDVVGVGVRLQDADDPEAEARGRLEVGLGEERRVDDDALAGVRVADEVRGTAEAVVDELAHEHVGEASSRIPLFS